MSQLAHYPARFQQGFRALSAANDKVRGNRCAFFGIERTKRVSFDQLAKIIRNLVRAVHDAVCNPSFNLKSPLRIQLFTVPSGSFNALAISEWLKPSKYASSIARLCCGCKEFMSSRTRVARRFSSSEPSKSGIATKGASSSV